MRQFGMFAKYWLRGQVKTRLAASEGPHRAAALYEAFLRTSLLRFAKVSAQRVLAFTPHNRRDDFAVLAGDSWQLQPQSDGDLGRRMQEYFESAFAAGYGEVLLVGSDSPTLPLEIIDHAFTALGQRDVVLGPTMDGGYYLLGASSRVPDIFDGIDWSTPQVWPQTVDRLRAAAVDFHVLAPWYDVDDRAALDRLSVELGDPNVDDPELLALRQVVAATDSR